MSARPQPAVGGRGGAAPLVDRGDDQPRAEHAVARGEDPGAEVMRSASVRRQAPGLSSRPKSVTSALCSVCTKPIAKTTRSAGSSNAEPGTSSNERRPAASGAPPGDLHAAQRADAPGRVAEDLLRRDPPEALAPLVVRGAGAQDLRPVRPGVVGGPLARRLGEDLDLGDRGRALAPRRPDAVGAGVPAADHDDAPAGRRQLVRVDNPPRPPLSQRGAGGFENVPGDPPVLRRQVIHRQEHPVPAPARGAGRRAARASPRPRRRRRRCVAGS